MGKQGRIYTPGSSGFFLFLLVLIFVLASFYIFSCAYAEGKTIVVDENNPPKIRRARTLTNTRVICINNSPVDAKAQTTEGNICPSLGGYYCRSVSKRAWLSRSGHYLGFITGVAWRDKGAAMGQYLDRLDSKDAPLKDALKRNITSASDSFYFIIDVVGIEGHILIQPHRVETGE